MIRKFLPVVFLLLASSLFAQTEGPKSGFGLVRADGEPSNLTAFEYDGGPVETATYIKRQSDGTWLIDLWIRPGDHGKNITHAQSKAEIDRAWREVGWVSGLKHRWVANEKDATLKFSVHDNEGMSNYVGGVKYYAAGIAWSQGRMWINGERDMALDRPGRRIFGQISLHEGLHSERVLRWGHTNDTKCVMNGALTTTTICRAEVLGLQRRFGKPKTIWFAMDKQLSSGRFWKLLDVRNELIAKRNAEPDPIKRAAIQNQVLKNLDKLIIEHDKFWAWNEYWRGVPMAHVHARR